MSGTGELRKTTVQRVLDGAQNNFLWVRLAVERLNLCHTQADVELVLQELPIGMEALYDRMALSITRNPSPTGQALASRILEYVTCSLRVLTVAELSIALDKETSQILDLQKAIGDVCGGFVVIDNGGNVAMIHQTAREYLLNSHGRPFNVDRSTAHKQIFFSCMRSLMTTGLKARVNRGEKPEFLEYAARSWPSHLVLSPVEDGQVLTVLDNFLKGQWLLIWIHIIATSKQLRVLIQASKHLSRYSSKRKEYDSRLNILDRQISEQEFIESWSVDLVKVVGKFGNDLRRNPNAIYKLIPPYCPQSSSIYQSFGKKEARSLMISGLSDEGWDDSLARMSLGLRTYASQIAASGTQIAILSSSGTVLIYNSTTFEEGSSIQHGERVYRMELNSRGTLLATYGYKSTKVWEVSTGECRMKVSNVDSRPRPLVMLFQSNDSKLLVGTDDKCIRSLDPRQPAPTWELIAELEEEELEGHILNAASYMALNNDGNLLAVAYRGHPLSAWEIDGPEHIGHCWRAREEVARGEVIRAVWHPYSAEVIGLYIEGVVFKWRPYDDETSELATGGSKLALSRDGNFFVTGDVHGTVKVYSTLDFCLIYQLASQDSVLGLAFDPSPTRFYDIRGSYGNVWEPNALIKLTEQTEKGSDSGSETGSLVQKTTISQARSRKVTPITALVSSPVGQLYCCGTEEGTVHLHDLTRGKVADIHSSKSFMSVEQMSWSDNGRYMCFSDASKRLIIMSITLGAKDSDPVLEKKSEITLNIVTKGPVLQLLFHPGSSHLLVYTSSTLTVVSLQSFLITKSIEWPQSESRWIASPQESSQILGIGTNPIHIVDWDLALLQQYDIEYAPKATSPTQATPLQRVVERVLTTHDKIHLLVQLSISNPSQKEKELHVFQLSALAVTLPWKTATISPFIIPSTFSSQVNTPLSFLSRDRLVFLSKELSICSWKLPFLLLPPPASTEPDLDRVEEIKQLFIMPGDWINTDSLALCSVWKKEKSLLCPRNGEVAVARCSALV